jgi:CheY-like chemotaxis protein
MEIYDDLKILLVEDSPNVLELTTQFLKEIGFVKIYTARDGSEALDRIRLTYLYVVKGMCAKVDIF